MRQPTILCLCLLASAGCAAQLRAQVTPQGTTVRAGVQGDARAAAAAGLIASGLSAIAEGGSADSQPATAATVHTPTTATSSPQGSLTTNASSVREGSVPAPPTSASVTTPSPAEASVRLGVGVAASLVRVAVAEGPDVLGGGAVRVDGAPDLRDLRIIDGRVTLRGAAPGVNTRVSGRSAARVELGGGMLLLEDGRGRRWRCRVDGGAMQLTTEGANPQGVAVWTSTESSLRVSVTVQGDTRLALTGDAPALTLATSPVALPARVMGALDALILAAPEGSAESLRLASAVQVAIRQAESADPAVYSVPVRGRSVALLIDVSYSMRDLDPAAVWLELGPEARPTKLDVARAELVKVLASLPEGTTVNLVAFSSAARALWTAPQTVTATTLDEAIRWLAALRPADETHPAGAIELAASMQPEQIVMISDGRPSGDASDGRELLGFVQGISVRTRLDVVGVGPDQDREFLAALAFNGRGSLRMR